MRILILASAILLAFLCASGRAETLTGIVQQQNGKPAPGARICVATVFHHPPLRADVTANDHGAFSIELLNGRQYRLAVRWQTEGADLTEGVDSDGRSVRLSGQKLPPQVVRLRAGGTLRGKLLRAEDDGPIAGARLFLDTGEVLTTDQEGIFTASGLPMKNHSLIPVAQGRVRPYVLFDTTLRTDAELELRLPRGALLKGRITDERGRPIPGACLRRFSSGDGLTVNGWDEVCAADGSFAYGGLSPERLFYGLVACAPGYLGQGVNAEVDDSTTVVERTFRLRKEPASQLPSAKRAEWVAPAKGIAGPARRIAAPPRRTLRGFVRDADGVRIAGARVRWGSGPWDSSRQPVTTNAEGEFSLPGIAGRGALVVTFESHAPQIVPVQAAQESVDVELSRGISLRGTVRGSAGQPIAGVRVVPITWSSDPFSNGIWLDECAAETDEKGEFKIHAIAPTGVRFEFFKEGYAEQKNVVLIADGPPKAIVLAAGGAIRGHVVDSRGEPVRNFRIRVLGPRDAKPDELTGGYFAGYDWYGIRYTNRGGLFTLTGLRADTWARLVVTSPGIGRAIVDRVKSEPLDRVSQEESLTVPLQPYVPLSVRVREAATNKPVEKGTAALLEDLPEFARGFTWGDDDLWSERRTIDRSGTALFTEPGCEDGTILVRSPGFARRRIPWTNGAREVTIALEPEAVIRGEVQFKGKRLADGYARLTSASQDRFQIELGGTSGRFNFDQLPAGAYELVISSRSEQVLAQRILTLTPGKVQIENIAISENGNAN
jgi:hypothetical protein